MAARPRPGSTRCWPSINGSARNIPSRRRSTSGARIPRRSPRLHWRRARRPVACRADGGSADVTRSPAVATMRRAIIGAFLGEKGDPRHIAYLLVPLAEVEIADDWQVLGLLGTGSKSLILRDLFVPEHRSVMVSDLFAGTPPGALVHPDYPVLRAPRGFLVSYSLPPVAIALGRRALDIARAGLVGRVSRGVTRVAESEVVQMAIGEAAAAIDVATLLLHTGRESSTAAVSSGRKITEVEALRARRDMVYASIRSAGRSIACASWTAPAGSTTATSWALFGAT